MHENCDDYMIEWNLSSKKRLQKLGIRQVLIALKENHFSWI